MKTMQAMQSIKAARKQQGFTIIELVVVILLLGILAATALPRFMDVTDEAHESVVDSVQGGLQTGVALYRAQWYAKGQPSTAVGVDWGSDLVAPNGNGYPLATTSAECLNVYNEILQAGRPQATSADAPGMTLDDASLQTAIGNQTAGQPVAVNYEGVSATNIAGAAGVNNLAFIAVLDGSAENSGTYYCSFNGADGCEAGYYDEIDMSVDDAYTPVVGGSCNYYYVGQYKATGEGLVLPVLSYSMASGEVSRATDFAFE